MQIAPVAPQMDPAMVRFMNRMGSLSPLNLTMMAVQEPWPYHDDYAQYITLSGKTSSASMAEAWMLHALAVEYLGANIDPAISCQESDQKADVAVNPFTDNNAVLRAGTWDKDHADFKAFTHVALNGRTAPERFYLICSSFKNLTNDTIRSMYQMVGSSIQVAEVAVVAIWISKAIGNWKPNDGTLAVANKYPWLKYRLSIASAGGLVMEAFRAVPPVLLYAVFGTALRNYVALASRAAENPHVIDYHHAIPEVAIAFAYVVLAAMGKDTGEWKSGQKAIASMPAKVIQKWRTVIANIVRATTAELDVQANETISAYITRISALISTN
jgi:hypothetical protein